MKKLMSIMAAAALTFSLAACGISNKELKHQNSRKHQQKVLILKQQA